MLVVINGLKIVLLAIVITYVIFHFGEYVNSLQVKRFKEKEDANRIIIPEKDICDTCEYLGYYGIDDNGESDYYCSFGHCHFKNAKDRCDTYSPSNRVKKSDITQVTVDTDSIHDATDKKCDDGMIDIKPLLYSASITDEDVKYLTASWIKGGFESAPVYICSNCNHMSSVMTNYCPNCHSIMIEQKEDTSNKEEKAEWKKCNRHGAIFYECSHCGNWTHYKTNYCNQCNYPMKSGWKAWFVERD